MDHPRWPAVPSRIGPASTLNGIADLLVHAATGRAVAVPGAFQHTSDDLVLTRAGGTLSCLALPDRRPHDDTAPGTDPAPAHRRSSIRALPKVFGFTRPRSRNSATPSS
jgi:hypothetical protein